MLIRLDPTSDLPLFEQIAGSVRADAAAGRLRSGDRLPPAREVAEALGINMHTVLHAYRSLRDEGVIELRRSRGALITDAAEGLASVYRDVHALVAKARTVGLSPDALAALIKETARAT